MSRAWALFKAHPYISNVVGYTTLFASADLIQQSIVTTWADIDWSQTARVAFVGFCFHANFNYHWLKGLERMLPGGGAKRVSGKVVLDQLVAAPATISAFFIGLSVLENKEDPLENWREKFWTSYKALNFSLVPPVARTVFVGGITLVWTVFLCHFRQQKDDTQTKPPSH
uniref:Si:ch211-120k19.1 n=1 Tax=Oncorhynchus kisutch TaxID=8019 RepID=A0A8C7J099_ONCKI